MEFSIIIPALKVIADSPSTKTLSARRAFLVNPSIPPHTVSAQGKTPTYNLKYFHPTEGNGLQV